MANDIESLIAPKRFDIGNGDLTLNRKDVRLIMRLNLPNNIASFNNVVFRKIEVPCDLPYLNHTGYELALIRSREKPLAVFHLTKGDNEREDALERLFQPVVAEGLICRRELMLDQRGGLTDSDVDTSQKVVFFAATGQEWRVDAYRLLQNIRQHTRNWNYEYERLEGALLGYSWVEQDAWSAHQKNLGLRFGFATLYCPIQHADSEFIQRFGFRSLPLTMSCQPSLFLSFEGVAPVIENSGDQWTLFARFWVSMRDFNTLLIPASTYSPTSPFSPFLFEEVAIPLINSLIDGDVEIISIG